jgi:predicted DNA-binding antitoxin AbrB/MazE fold protein
MKAIRMRWKGGKFVPLEPVDLAEGTPVLLRHIRIVRPGEQPAEANNPEARFTSLDQLQDGCEVVLEVEQVAER